MLRHRQNRRRSSDRTPQTVTAAAMQFPAGAETRAANRAVPGQSGSRRGSKEGRGRRHGRPVEATAVHRGLQGAAAHHGLSQRTTRACWRVRSEANRRAAPPRVHHRGAPGFPVPQAIPGQAPLQGLRRVPLCRPETPRVRQASPAHSAGPPAAWMDGPGCPLQRRPLRVSVQSPFPSPLQSMGDNRGAGHGVRADGNTFPVSGVSAKVPGSFRPTAVAAFPLPKFP